MISVHMEKVKNYKYEVVSENQLIYQLRAGLYIYIVENCDLGNSCSLCGPPKQENNRYFHSKKDMHVHEEPAHAASLELSARLQE